MTTPALHPDAVKAKYDLLKRWRDTEAGRKETLSSWKVTRLDDGALMVSARVRGPNPGQAFDQFVDRQAMYLANRMGSETTDRLPALDVTDPGRTAVVWRTDGVWVELWHPAEAAGRPQPRQAAPEPSTAVQGAPTLRPSPSTIPAARRSLLTRASGRLPYTRRNKTPKENTTA